MQHCATITLTAIMEAKQYKNDNATTNAQNIALFGWGLNDVTYVFTICLIKIYAKSG